MYKYQLYMLSRAEEYRIIPIILSSELSEYFSPYNTQTWAHNIYTSYIHPNTFCFVFLSVASIAPDSITTWEVQAISISPQKGKKYCYSIGFIL